MNGGAVGTVVNALTRGATDGANTVTAVASRRRIGRGVLRLLLTVTAAVMLAACSEGEAVTIADYWGLNATPAATVTPARFSAESPTPAATATATVTATPAPTDTPVPTAALVVVESAAAVSADGRTYIVLSGDHLWKIARAALRNATGTEPGNRSIAAYVAAIVAANELRNPDLIYPNETFLLPTR